MNKDLYFVALKVFLEDSQGNFLIFKDKFGDWDLPGGRLRENDFGVSFEAIIERKICEELGREVKYILGEPVVFMRHERDEILSSGTREKRRIFAIGYRATYQDGKIILGKHHETYEWASRKNIKPENYFNGGWLKGVQEYLQKNLWKIKIE